MPMGWRKATNQRPQRACGRPRPPRGQPDDGGLLSIGRCAAVAGRDLAVVAPFQFARQLLIDESATADLRVSLQLTELSLDTLLAQLEQLLPVQMLELAKWPRKAL